MKYALTLLFTVLLVANTAFAQDKNEVKATINFLFDGMGNADPMSKFLSAFLKAKTDGKSFT